MKRGLAAGFAGLALGAGLWLAPAPWAHRLEGALGVLRPAAEVGRRGGIYDRTGEPLAVSWEEPSGPVRRYQVPESLAPVVGYVDPRLGRAGLERSLDERLAARGGGRDVALTVSRALQVAAEEAFEGRAGAAVVLTVPEGEILALVSLPGFDPQQVGERWAELRLDPGAALFPRATAGLYPPGSAFKVAVMAAALEAGAASEASRYWDGGSLSWPGGSLRDPGGRPAGWLRLDEALTRSSNVVFGRLGLKMGSRLVEAARRLGFGRAPALEVPTAAGRLPEEPVGPGTAALLGIGQGAIEVSPLQMAVLAGVIATGGREVTPRLVRWVAGEPPGLPPQGGWLLDARVAQAVGKAMTLAVAEGTGRAARGTPGIAGKTGTAEAPGGAPHAWFIGFAPAERPRVAAAVVVEHGGAGGRVAAPIAARILRAAEAMVGGGG
ncbi:penicillin-binding transpeptidase domain-containing protein [Limnochorda pilosa]|uniref:Cell division protein FtsI n=1 Tax=Limnochorda pilosa TaxID=1555112 RepID=A0A0K2SKQ9_LIMPI|nr:penicillin-binding transpeptidase domain-containing protein [Limnochorda pilosa]BAS27444.1 cell division protein FtsI [Limnochorda pilosa]